MTFPLFPFDFESLSIVQLYFIKLYNCRPTCKYSNFSVGNFLFKQNIVVQMGSYHSGVITGFWKFLFFNNFTNPNLDKFGWTKKKILERDLNLRPPDWRAGALPTELSSPTLAVSLFCQYLCSGAPVRSHETIYCPLARDHAQVTIQPGNRWGCTIKGYDFVVYYMTFI